MKVSELISELQKIENQDATIHISCLTDFECLDFEVASDTSDNSNNSSYRMHTKDQPGTTYPALCLCFR